MESVWRERPRRIPPCKYQLSFFISFSWTKADAIFKEGLQRKAKPIERLKQTHADFLTRVPPGIKLLGNNHDSKPRYQEIPGYDASLLGPNQDHSFVERRAEYYRRMGWEKPLNNHQQTTGMNWSKESGPSKELYLGRGLKGSILKEVVEEEEDDLDNLPLPHAVNPDDLTHISVYRDNTADIKELKELALRTKQVTSIPPTTTQPPTNNTLLPTPKIFKATHVKALAALQSIQKKLGRDGSGPNHTVSSFKLANGNLFFLERQLDVNRDVYEFVAVDLQNISLEEDKAEGKYLVRGEACLVVEESLLLHEVCTSEKFGLFPKHRSIVQYVLTCF